MRKYAAPPVLLIFLVGSNASVCVGDKIPLLTGRGAAETKTDIQQLSEDCVAKRSWIELHGTDHSDAEKTINRWIRRAMSVGKTLKKDNCPGSYQNTATISGQRSGFIGVEIDLSYSPQGASGWGKKECPVFDLRTGRRATLVMSKSSSAKKQLAESFCAAKHQTPNGQTLCENPTQLQKSPYLLDETTFCLVGNGIRAFTPARGRFFIFDTVIPNSEAAKILDLPNGMQLQ